MRLSLIVAMTRTGVIGRSGQLPWKLAADLKRFKSLTMGHHLIMGRKTFESLGRALPGRISVVITRQAQGNFPEGVLAAHSQTQAIDLAAADTEPFIIGGGQVFEQAVPRVDRLYVTWVEANVEGDVRFPVTEWAQWCEVHCERHSADEKNEYDTTFCIYDRA
jgi:dihydrofolate reductase